MINVSKKNTSTVLLIRYLADGPRDYPLKDGSSIYLPPRGKPAYWAEISEAVFSEALARAEERGLIDIKRNETTFAAPSEAVPEVTV